MTGIISYWNIDRGWGFARVDGEADVFVHHAALVDDGDLRPGTQISFDRVPGYVGMVAANVAVLPPSAA